MGSAFLMASCLMASEPTCIEQLSQFVRTYNLDHFKNGKVTEQSESDNEMGQPGEKIYTKTYRNKDDWATITECASCSPSGGIVSVMYLSATKSASFPCGLIKGMRIDRVKSILGEPSEPPFEGGLVYYTPEGECGHDLIIIEFDQGKLVGIKWEPGNTC